MIGIGGMGQSAQYCTVARTLKHTQCNAMQSSSDEYM